MSKAVRCYNHARPSEPCPPLGNFYRDLIPAFVALRFGRLFPIPGSPPADLNGKVAIVTGGTSGIGLQIAIDLARQGSTVYLACLNISEAEEAITHIISQVPASKGRVKSLSLDTSSLESIRSFASEWETLKTKIDLLFHNAGIGSSVAGQEYSVDGFPIIYATNFLGSFLLTSVLESHLSSAARIIMTSSSAQYASAFAPNLSLNSIKEDFEPGFHVPLNRSKSPKMAFDNAAYIQTKATQVAFAKLLQNHFDRKAADSRTQNHRVAYALTLGFVRTSILGKVTTTSFFGNLVL